MSGYRIADEPQASPWQSMAVDPLWPLLAIMFCGSWLALPWFAFNAVALGSPTRQRELAVAGGALLLTFGWSFVILGTTASDTDLAHLSLMTDLMPYLFLVTLAIKLVAAYWLHTAQARTFELFRYFGGTPRNGLFVVIGGALLRGAVLGLLSSDHHAGLALLWTLS